MRGPVVVLGLLVGCGGGPVARGEVDGERPSFTHAFYLVDATDDGGEVVRITLSEADCADTAAYYAEFAQLYDPEAEAALWSSTFPAEFWTLQWTAEFPAAPTPGTLGGFPFGEAGGGQGFRAVATHYLKTLDSTYFSDVSVEEQYRLDYYSDGGSMDVIAYEDAASIEVSGTFPLVRRDGAAAGEVEVRAKAEHCLPMAL